MKNLRNSSWLDEAGVAHRPVGRGKHVTPWCNSLANYLRRGPEPTVTCFWCLAGEPRWDRR